MRTTTFRLFPLPLDFDFFYCRVRFCFLLLMQRFLSLSLSSLFLSVPLSFPTSVFFSIFPQSLFQLSFSSFSLFFSRLCSFTSACAKRGAQNDSRKTRVTKRTFGITDDGESWRWSCGLFHGRVIRLELYVSGVLDLISTIAFATYAQRRRPYLAR